MRDRFRVTPGMRSKDKLTAATAYIKAGKRLLLTHGIDSRGRCTCGRKNCPSPGKHPLPAFPKGVHSATRSIAKIKRVLAGHPNANLALCLEGHTVVDIDGDGGEAAVAGLGLPETAKVITSRGSHLHYIGELERGSFKVHQLDLLTGASRYAMLPPSIHESGHLYRWDAGAPADAAASPLELDSLRKATKKAVVFSDAKIRRGERNDRLFNAARVLRMRGFSEAAVLDAVGAINQRDCTEPLDDPELTALVRSSGRYAEKPDDLFGPPRQTEPLPMEFLWYPYIPRHAVTILAGDPGSGKSLLMAMLIGVVTGGKKWPLSNERPDGDKVLILSAEDNWARVTLRRLIKAGANIDNLHVMHKFRTLSDERLAMLADYVRDWRPDLIIIDTLAAYMGGGRDMHRQNEVGEFLAFLNEIAEETGCAIVALAHLNKQTAEHPMFRIVGSIGFTASIRSALFFGTDPLDRSRPAMAHGKANGSELGPSVVFEKVGGGRDDVPVLHVVGDTDATAVDICKIERSGVGRPSSESDAAREFIMNYLDPVRPRPWAQLIRNAESRAIASAATLANVRADLAKNGQIHQVGKGPRAMWLRTVSEGDGE